MEHKLILGGEKYLPFARSIIRKLRSAGLRYAAPRPLMLPDATVTVRIDGEHEYIRLEGSSFSFLSGTTRLGTITTGSPDVLHEFHIDAGAWRTVYKQKAIYAPYNEAGDTALWYDEKNLALTAHADLGTSGSQYCNVCSSMYSGLMAKAAQAILGLGKLTGSAVQLRYNFRWACTHGIVTDSLGKLWLVEISSTNGVIAMRLPTLAIPTSPGLDYNLDVVRNLFGGRFPSGGVFPSDIAAAIAAGNVIRLAEVADLSAYHSKLAYSDSLGWSFNQSGSEAHNTCYSTSAGVYTGYHYKLAISITGGDTPSGSATLTLVSSGDLHGVSRFMFWDFDAQTYRKTPTRAWAGGALPAEEQQTTIFVFHRNDTLERVYHYSVNGRASYSIWNPGIKFRRYFLGNGTTTAITENPAYYSWKETHGAVNKESYLTCDSYPGFAAGTFDRTDVTGSGIYGQFTLAGFPGITWDAWYWSTERRFGTLYSSRGLWPDGTRDGFVFRDYGGGGLQLETGTTYDHVNPSTSPYFGADGAQGIDQSYVSPTTVALPDGTTGYLYGQSNYDAPETTTGLDVPAGGLSITNSELENIKVFHALDRMVTYQPSFASSVDHGVNNDLWNNITSIFNVRSSVLDEGFNYLSSMKVDTVDDVDVSALFAFLGDSDGVYESSRICFVGVTSDNYY